MKGFITIALKPLLLMVSMLGLFLQAQAQFEPQFTQFMFNETFINPAYTGSREHIALAGLYRNQWVGIDGAPKTQTFSAHSPLRNERIGLGLNILNEEIGVTHDFSFFANYAYRIPMQKGTFAMGISAGLINHQEQLVDVNIQEPGDGAFFGTPKLTVPNVGFGTYYSSRNFYIGLSVPRLLQNKVDAESGKAQNKVTIPYWHYYLMGGYVHPLNESVKIKPTFMVKAVSGSPIIADVGLNFLFSEVLWVGGAYRTSDSWAALISFQINSQLRMGYSYDYTITDLQKYNSGTHEITLGYDFSFNKNKVVTPRYF